MNMIQNLQSYPQYGTISGSGVEAYLKSFDNPPNMVAERYESMPNFESGLKRIENDSEYAFVWLSPSFDYILRNHPCNISTIPNYKLFPSSVSMFVQKNSQFTGIFNF